MILYTIGVYNSTEDEFFNKLIDNNIDLFCDIRQRRGVRGSQYKFVNNNYLQAKLKELGINYLYKKDLAPTSEIRQRQKDADKELGVMKKTRNTLGKVFKILYQKEILETYDLRTLIDEFKSSGAEKIIFFCVEEKPEACHRSLVVEALKNVEDLQIIHL